MDKTLETLWSAYETGFPSKQSDREKELLHTLVISQERLHVELNEEQRRTLETLEECLAELRCITDRESFIRGIRFATGYLVEAMYNI